MIEPMSSRNLKTNSRSVSSAPFLILRKNHSSPNLENFTTNDEIRLIRNKSLRNKSITTHTIMISRITNSLKGKITLLLHYIGKA